jgi:tetratricopeptide (TPR) repeat protein
VHRPVITRFLHSSFATPAQVDRKYMHALDTMEDALKLRLQKYGIDSPDSREAMRVMAIFANRLARGGISSFQIYATLHCLPQSLTVFRSPSHYCLLRSLSPGCMEQGKLSRVLELLDKADKLSAWDRSARVQVATSYGCYFRRLGRLHAALRWLSHAAELEAPLMPIKRQPETQLNLSCIHSELGSYADALRHARAAIRLYQEQLFSPQAEWWKMRDNRSTSMEEKKEDNGGAGFAGLAALAKSRPMLGKEELTLDQLMFGEGSDDDSSEEEEEREAKKQAAEELRIKEEVEAKYAAVVGRFPWVGNDGHWHGELPLPKVACYAGAYHCAGVQHQKQGHLKPALKDYQLGLAVANHYLGDMHAMTLILRNKIEGCERELVLQALAERLGKSNAESEARTRRLLMSQQNDEAKRKKRRKKRVGQKEKVESEAGKTREDMLGSVAATPLGALLSGGGDGDQSSGITLGKLRAAGGLSALPPLKLPEPGFRSTRPDCATPRPLFEEAPAFSKYLAQIFKKYDADGSGDMDAQEFEACLASLVVPLGLVDWEVRRLRRQILKEFGNNDTGPNAEKSAKMKRRASAAAVDVEPAAVDAKPAPVEGGGGVSISWTEFCLNAGRMLRDLHAWQELHVDHDWCELPSPRFRITGRNFFYSKRRGVSQWDPPDQERAEEKRKALLGMPPSVGSYVGSLYERALQSSTMNTGLLAEELFFNILQGSLMHLDAKANDCLRKMMQKYIYRGKEASEVMEFAIRAKNGGRPITAGIGGSGMQSVSLVDWHEFIAVCNKFISEAYGRAAAEAERAKAATAAPIPVPKEEEEEEEEEEKDKKKRRRKVSAQSTQQPLRDVSVLTALCLY